MQCDLVKIGSSNIDRDGFILLSDMANCQGEKRTEQNIYFIDVNCTVSCQIHEYNNKFTNRHNRCIHDLTTKS